MPIPAKEAAQIARKAGLSLTDARALAAMADSEEDAEELAKTFGEAETDYKAIADRITNKGL